jgi:hypothetical protein
MTRHNGPHPRPHPMFVVCHRSAMIRTRRAKFLPCLQIHRPSGRSGACAGATCRSRAAAMFRTRSRGPSLLASAMRRSPARSSTRPRGSRSCARSSLSSIANAAGQGEADLLERGARAGTALPACLRPRLVQTRPERARRRSRRSAAATWLRQAPQPQDPCRQAARRRAIRSDRLAPPRPLRRAPARRGVSRARAPAA